MRKSLSLLFGAMTALAMGSLTGCSDDDFAVQQEKADRDQTRYLNVSIATPKGAGTRAEDGNFEYGSATENFVKSLTLVFYDAQGLPTGTAYDKTFTTNTTNDGFTNNTTAPNENVEKIWTATVDVDLAQGENLPAYVVAYLNPVSTGDLKTRSLAELDEVIRQQVKNDEGNFPMSNSVYYGNNPVTGATNVRVFATPISAQQLYTSKEDAEAAGAQTVDIYVERYAARVQLNMSPDAIHPNATAVNGYTLTFVPEAWRVNATDKDLYVVKRFGIADADGVDYNPSFTDLNTLLGAWWNEPEKFRSYWGTTPSYYANSYPSVSDNITDVAANNDYSGTGTTEYPYAEHYFSYSQFISGEVTGAKFPAAITWTTEGFNQPFYARETTTSVAAWRDVPTIDENNKNQKYNPLATIASAVIVGHYELEATGGVAAVPTDDKTFYLFGKTGDKYNLYFEDNKVTAGKGILAAMVAQQSVVLQREGTAGNYTYKEYKGTTGFKVEHPSKGVRDVKGTTVAGRLVALQLDGTYLANLYYYDATAEGEKYVPITAGETGNLNKVNSELLTAGYATKYGDGIAYFNIPIEHLGIYQTINGENKGTYIEGVKDQTKNTYDFTKCPAGSFGIVRNHAYTINVESISGLGTALRDKNQPIVPPANVNTYYISAKLNILSWRIVPVQNVIL